MFDRRCSAPHHTLTFTGRGSKALPQRSLRAFATFSALISVIQTHSRFNSSGRTFCEQLRDDLNLEFAVDITAATSFCVSLTSRPQTNARVAQRLTNRKTFRTQSACTATFKCSQDGTVTTARHRTRESRRAPRGEGTTTQRTTHSAHTQPHTHSGGRTHRVVPPVYGRLAGGVGVHGVDDGLPLPFLVDLAEAPAGLSVRGLSLEVLLIFIHVVHLETVGSRAQGETGGG